MTSLLHIRGMKALYGVTDEDIEYAALLRAMGMLTGEAICMLADKKQVPDKLLIRWYTFFDLFRRVDEQYYQHARSIR